MVDVGWESGAQVVEGIEGSIGGMHIWSSLGFL